MRRRNRWNKFKFVLKLIFANCGCIVSHKPVELASVASRPKHVVSVRAMSMYFGFRPSGGPRLHATESDRLRREPSGQQFGNHVGGTSGRRGIRSL